MSAITHDGLIGNLAAHLAAQDRLIWCDMQIGPMHSARPDVFTMRKSYSNPSPASYECKVSVADFRADITSGKWQSYLKFSGSVTFAVPSGLVKLADIPIGCGFMSLSDDGWKVHRHATRQSTWKLGTDQMIKLLIDGWGREHSQVQEKTRQFRTRRAQNEIARKHGTEVAAVIRDLGAARSMVDHYRNAGQREVDLAHKLAEDVREQQRSAWAQLAVVCGLPGDARQYEITQAIRALRNPVDLNEELANALRAAKRSIDAAVAKIPEVEGVQV